MNKLFILALLSDLLTPFLIWEFGLPEEIRWISLVALIAMMASGYIRLLRRERVPNVALPLVMLSIIGVLVALLNGQGLQATAWGWWMMFKYPLVGLYMYLETRWPRDFPQWLRTWCIRLLVLELAVQIGQYLTGEIPGDNLAGTLGVHGTSNLVMVILWVVALALGDWIAKGNLGRVGLVLAIGLASSALGEMKLFPFAAGFMGILALMVHVLRTRKPQQALSYVAMLGLAVGVFPAVYNYIVPASSRIPFTDYLTPESLDSYLGGVRSTGSGSYDVGRNYGLEYSWERINASTATLLFGEGLGARGESKTLNSEGIAILTGGLGLYTGTSLVVIMGELGLTGLVSLSMFVLCVVVLLVKVSGSERDQSRLGLQYGLLIYTIMWPLWLWYSAAWVSPVPMLLYWMTLGYVLSPARSLVPDTKAVPVYTPVERSRIRIIA